MSQTLGLMVTAMALGAPTAMALEYASLVGNWEVEILDSVAGRIEGEVAFHPDETPAYLHVGNWFRSAHGSSNICLQSERMEDARFYARFYCPNLFPKGGHSSRHLNVTFSEDGNSGQGAMHWGKETFARVRMRKMTPRVQATVWSGVKHSSPATVVNGVLTDGLGGTIWVRLEGSGLPLHMWKTQWYEKIEVYDPGLRFWRTGSNGDNWWLAFYTRPDTQPGRKVISVNGAPVAFNLLVQQPDGSVLGDEPEVAVSDGGVAGTIQTPLGPCTRFVLTNEDGVPTRIVDRPLGEDEPELVSEADPETGRVRTVLNYGNGRTILRDTLAELGADGIGRILETDGFGNETGIREAEDGTLEIRERDVFGHTRKTAETKAGSLIGSVRDPLGTTIETVERADGSTASIVSDDEGRVMAMTTLDGERSATITDAEGELRTLAADEASPEPAEGDRSRSLDELDRSLEDELARIRKEQQAAERKALARKAREERERQRDEATEKMKALNDRILVARAEGDVEKQRRLEAEHDRIHDETLDLFLPTEDEEREMARAQAVRDELVDDIASRARRLADMKIRELDVAQGLKEEVTAGTRYVSIGSEMQQQTARTTRLADREKAFAKAKQDLIREKLEDPATTPEQRKVLEDMMDLSRVQLEGAQRLLNDNARLTTVAYGVDAALLLSGGIGNGAVAATKGLTTKAVAANAARNTFARQMAAGASRKAATEAAEATGQAAVKALGERVASAQATVEGTRMGGALSAALQKDLVPGAVQQMAGRLGEHQLVQRMAADATIGAGADVGVQLYQTGEVDLAQTARAATAGAMLAGGLSATRRGIDTLRGPTPHGPPPGASGTGQRSSPAADSAAVGGAGEPPVGSLSRDLTPGQIRRLHEPGRNLSSEEIMAKADLYLDLQRHSNRVNEGRAAKLPEAEMREIRQEYLDQWNRIEDARATQRIPAPGPTSTNNATGPSHASPAGPAGPPPGTGDRIRTTERSESPTVLVPRKAKEGPKTERIERSSPTPKAPARSNDPWTEQPTTLDRPRRGSEPTAAPAPAPAPHETRALRLPPDHAAPGDATTILDAQGRPIAHRDGGVVTTDNVNPANQGPHGTQRLGRSPLEAGPHEKTTRIDARGRPVIDDLKWDGADASDPPRATELLPEDAYPDGPEGGPVVEELLPEHIDLERTPIRSREEVAVDKWSFERERILAEEQAARAARERDLQLRKEQAPRFRAPDGGSVRNANFRQLVAGDAGRLKHLMSDMQAVQSEVYAGTINAYAQRMIDGSFAWEQIPAGQRITLGPDGKLVVHGHHRYIAARIASAVTGRPLTQGTHPIIPPHGFDPPSPRLAAAARGFDIKVNEGFKPADGTTLPEYGTGAP